MGIFQYQRKGYQYINCIQKWLGSLKLTSPPQVKINPAITNIQQKHKERKQSTKDSHKDRKYQEN